MPRILIAPVILKILSRSDCLSTPQIFERTIFNKNSIREALRQLEKKGQIKRVKTDGQVVFWGLTKV